MYYILIRMSYFNSYVVKNIGGNKMIKTISNGEIVLNLISILTKSILLIIFVSVIVIQLSNRTITPIKMNGSDRVSSLATAIQDLPVKVSKDEIYIISKSICLASDATNISESILTAKIFIESRMNKNAVSSAGYTGLSQSVKGMKFQYSEVDVMNGAKELQDWIKYRKGNLRYALASYNGGTYPPPVSFDYADNVIKLSRKIQKSFRT
jgi:hypothetical protein